MLMESWVNQTFVELPSFMFKLKLSVTLFWPLCVCVPPPPSRHVLSYHEEAREAAVQPHLPAGLLATTQHFPSASSPGPNRCRTQWWVLFAKSGALILINTVKKSMLIHNLPSGINDDRFILICISLSARLPVCLSRSYIDEEPPSTLAPAVLGLGHLAPGPVALLLAHHHPLPAPPQPCWSPQELRAVIRPVQPTEQPGQLDSTLTASSGSPLSRSALEIEDKIDYSVLLSLFHYYKLLQRHPVLLNFLLCESCSWLMLFIHAVG